MKISRVAFLILIFANFAFAAEPRVVEIYKVHKQKFLQQVNLIGTLTSKQEINFSAKFDGVVTKINKSDGALVNSGEEILEMENESSGRSFQVAKQSESMAFIQYQKALQLFQKGHVSQSELNERQHKWNIEQQNLAKFKKDFEDSVFKAPFKGKLGVFQIKVGSYLKAGDKIVTLYTPDALVIDLNIPESILLQLQEGAKAITLGKEFTISSLQRSINPETLMADARVDLGNLKISNDLFIGKPIGVTVILKEKQNALMVPKVAVFIKEGKNKIFKIKDGKAVLTEVEIEMESKEEVVLSKGVEEGDNVILYGQSYLQDGDAVVADKK